MLRQRLGNVFFLAGVGLHQDFTEPHATRTGGSECLVNLSEGDDSKTNEDLAEFLTGLTCQRNLLTDRTLAADHPAVGRATRTPYLRTGRAQQLHLTPHMPVRVVRNGRRFRSMRPTQHLRNAYGREYGR